MFLIHTYINDPRAFIYFSDSGDCPLSELRKELGNRKSYQWFTDKRGYSWLTFNKAHLELATQVLPKRFGEGHVYKEYNNRQTCTSSCQRAYRDSCECSCLGASHGRSDGYWRNPFGDLLFQDERTIVYYRFPAISDEQTFVEQAHLGTQSPA